MNISDTSHNDDLVFNSVDFDPFAGSEPIRVATTEAQREIWTNVQFGGHAANCAYNESVSLHLNGNFQFEHLQKAVQLLFERHPALRSTFSNDGMEMKISDSVSLDVPLIDLSAFSEEIASAKVKDILIGEAEHDFDLANGPLGKISVIKFNHLKHQLVLTFHHIVCDGWSLGIIMQDLSKMYSALVKGEQYTDEPAISYVEYAIDEQHYLSSKESADVENYWLKQYQGNIPAMELPLNKQRPALRTYSAKRIDVEVNPDLIDSIKKIGAKQGTSFVATFVAAFEIFMYRITGSEDVVVGLAAAGQSLEGKQNLVGHCVNLLPLRSKINPFSTFNEYLKLRKPQILDAYDHQRYTFGSLIQKLNIPRDPSRIPLVPVSFNVDLGITNGVDFEGCSYTFTTNPRHYENFEFFINAAGSGREMTLECTYNTDLFDDEMMLNRVNEFVELLKSISKNADGKIAFYNLLTETENQLLFQQWKGKETNYPFVCIHELFEKAAINFPGNIALIYGEKTISYKDLDDRANQLASHLISLGVGPDSMVAVFMERSIDLMISILGILKAGGAYVPIDLSYPVDRVSYLINDCKAPVVITQKNLLDKVDSAGATTLCSEDFDQILKKHSMSKRASEVSPRNTCYVIYTSGSTGNPKGVIVEHYTVVNYIAWCNDYYFGNKEFGNFGLYSSLSFDLTVTSIFCSLTRGKSLTVFNQFEDVPDILRDSFGSKTEVDVIKMTPAHILVLENLGLKTDKIKKAIVGGEELTTRHVEILQSINPAMEIVNEYGPTEATVGCVIKDVIHPKDALTIGKPIDNAEVFILDANYQPLPPGVPGRLFIGGGGLARGYHNRPDLTSEKFQILTINGEPMRLYDSGDLVRHRLTGEIEFLGRIDNQVKVRGYRIELGEIESQLITLPSVKEQIVIAREDEPGDKKLVAYIVLISGTTTTPEVIKEQLRKKLPEYMIPSAFVILDEMPLTVNGKIDRKALPVPGKISSGKMDSYEEPKTGVEEVLANIWCSVLGLEKVGRMDNFFELGGHSIIGVKMFNEVEKQLGVRIQLSVIFRASTIEELARVINSEESSKPWSCLVPLQEKGSMPPLFCIHMHNGNVHRWRVLVKHLGDNQPVYAIQPRGLNDKEKPHTTIEEMARYYIGVMKEVQPSGPYHLIGLCFSGMVVFEMAAMLEAQGEKVAFLGMLNNYAPPENPTIYKVKSELNKFMKMEMGDKFNYAIEKNMNLGKKLFTRAKGFLPSEKATVIPEIQIDEPVIEVGNDLRTIHSLALLNYHPSHIYNGPLVIFRTADPIEAFYNEHLGWDRLIKGKIETTIIEGCNNDTIITDEPFNVIVSLKLKEYLDRLHAENPKNGDKRAGGMFSAALL